MVSALRAGRTGVRLLAASVLAWTTTALAQPVEYRLSQDDPNTNSDAIRSAVYSPDGALLAVGYGRFIGLLQEPRAGQAVIWETRTGKQVATVAGQEDGVCSVAFAPDGKTLAVCEYPGIIRLCEVPGGRVRRTIRAPALTAGAIVFSPDGKRLAAGLWTGSRDGVSPPGNDVLVWDAASGAVTQTLRGHADAVRAAAFSPDGKLLVSGGDDGVARVWDLAEGRSRLGLAFPEVGTPPGRMYPVAVDSVAFSPDGRTFAAAVGTHVAFQRVFGIGEATAWDVATGQKVATLPGKEGRVSQVAFSPDGKLLAAAGSEGTIRLWDTASYQAAGEFKGWAPIAYSPDGRELVSRVDERTLSSRRIAEVTRQ